MNHNARILIVTRSPRLFNIRCRELGISPYNAVLVDSLERIAGLTIRNNNVYFEEDILSSSYYNDVYLYVQMRIMEYERSLDKRNKKNKELMHNFSMPKNKYEKFADDILKIADSLETLDLKEGTPEWNFQKGIVASAKTYRLSESLWYGFLSKDEVIYMHRFESTMQMNKVVDEETKKGVIKIFFAPLKANDINEAINKVRRLLDEIY